jgi:serine/threonine-protein kinase
VSLATGLRLAQYEILAPIASGGMGEVYRARDSRLDRDVAIKVMAAHVAADPTLRQRFESEARAVAALSHPSILSIYELGVVNGLSFAVMELLDGETLRQRLSAGALQWREAVGIAASVAEGLAAAHAKGVIHRDLKPENLFLTRDGAVKILDFGLAAQRMSFASVDRTMPAVAQTEAGVVLGTFGYMSPEQILGQPVDGRSDIFSLGCVLYEMLSGRRLIEGATPQEMIANVLRDSVPELSLFDPLAPAELRLIVARALDRDASRRFESARDMAMALRALLTGSGSGLSLRGMGRSRGKSLAVLPFLSPSGNQQIEYMTDGITESIINALSQVPGLRVVPRSLTFRYKGREVDPATVGLALNARTILTGRVIQQGEQLNIQTELVDTASQSQLWGEQFRQNVSDLMAVQEEIAWQISEALRLKLSGRQKKRLKTRATVKPEAYDEYLRGRYHWNSWSADGFRRALEHFERAIGHDPLYAAAWAGLGDAYSVMAYYGMAPPSDLYPKAKAAADKAIKLDGELADPYVTLGVCALFWGWNWKESTTAFETAIRLNPQLARAHLLYALLHSSLGKHDESLRLARLARELEPLSPVVNMGIPWSLHFADRREEALVEARRVEELSPGFEEAGNLQISCLENLGRFEEAAAIMKRQPCWGLPADPEALIRAIRAEGPAGYWRTRLDLLLPLAETPSGNREYQIALALGFLGRLDEAIEGLQRCIGLRAGMCVFLKIDPNLKAVRPHPGFAALVDQVGIGR